MNPINMCMIYMFYMMVIIGSVPTYAFLPPIPPASSLLPEISKLETILSEKAIMTSIVSNIRNEFTLEHLMIQMMDINVSMQHNHTIYIFFSVFILYVYGQWKFYDGTINYAQRQKWRKINKYYRIEKISKELLFVILFIFMKDVQSVL